MRDGVAMRNREQTFQEGSRQRPGTDDEIFKRRINELGLKLEGSVLEILLRELEFELVKKGITKVKPAAYLTDEWGCPEGVDRKSTRLNSSHSRASRMPSSA